MAVSFILCCNNIFYKFKIISYNFSNLQASGRAVYINDIAGQPGECYAEFVLSTEANAKIQSIDPSEALVNLDLFLIIKIFFGTLHVKVLNLIALKFSIFLSYFESILYSLFHFW